MSEGNETDHGWPCWETANLRENDVADLIGDFVLRLSGLLAHCRDGGGRLVKVRAGRVTVNNKEGFGEDARRTSSGPRGSVLLYLDSIYFGAQTLLNSTIKPDCAKLIARLCYAVQKCIYFQGR